MTRAVVIGIGNEYRRDDGIGLAVITALAEHDLPGVRLVVSDGEPSRLLADWAGVDLAIVVDAVLCEPSRPGRVDRTSVDELRPHGNASSHGLGIPEAVALARVLDRLPCRMLVYAVEAADVSLGVGLTPAVTAALPGLVDAVLADLRVDGAGPSTAGPRTALSPHGGP
jgi:hydrogenase maturation protease